MIYTSYFAIYKGTAGICIAAKQPTLTNYSIYPELFPTWEIVKHYKQTGDTNLYTSKYKNILSKLDPHKVYKDLDEKVLLCWEKPDKFCHRHLVAKWLIKYGYEVKELWEWGYGELC